MSVNFVAASTHRAIVGTTGALRNVPGGTLMAWINPTSLAAARHTIFGCSVGTSGSTSRAKLSHDGTGLEGFGRALDANSAGVFLAGTLSTGTWQHIAAKFDYVARTIELFINGVSVGVSAVITGWTSGNSSDTDSVSCNLASQHGGTSELFDGRIDDARMYGRLLSVAEIETIYATRGVDGITNGLQHRFLLNEAAPGVVVTTLVNIGPLRNNGTPGGSPTYAESVLRKRRKLVS